MNNFSLLKNNIFQFSHTCDDDDVCTQKLRQWQRQKYEQRRQQQRQFQRNHCQPRRLIFYNHQHTFSQTWKSTNKLWIITVLPARRVA